MEGTSLMVWRLGLPASTARGRGLILVGELRSHKLWGMAKKKKKKRMTSKKKGDFFGGWVVKNPPANAWDARNMNSIPGLARSPGEEKGYPLQYSCLRIPQTEEPGGLQSIGSQRVRHDWAPFTFTFKYNCYYKAQSFSTILCQLLEFFHINTQRASSFLLLWGHVVFQYMDIP